MKYLRRLFERMKATKFGRLFLDKRFFHYTWIGVCISALHIVALWFLIDVLRVPTVLSSTAVIGTTFILRYVLFRRFESL